VESGRNLFGVSHGRDFIMGNLSFFSRHPPRLQLSKN
jgi:hypothetical protein